MFTTDSVKGLLLGLKTQTRRTRGLNEINKNPDAWERIGYDQSGRFSFRWIGGDRILNIRCPFGGVGDIIWVRETWNYNLSREKYIYRASYDTPERKIWRPSIFMPKVASRITLELTEPPFPQHIQDITEADAKAEGATRPPNYSLSEKYIIQWFRVLWDSINAKRGYGWDTNCWVWRLPVKEIPV